MTEDILVAALGEYPAVITGMVKALRVVEGISVDTLHVLYPQRTGKEIAQLGYPLVEEHLRGCCQVLPEPLPFADADTEEHSLSFLRTLARVLQRYEDVGHYRVYLSLASGRKNMSALIALVTQFFPAVRGLYHLVPHGAARSSGFPSIEQLVLMPEARQRRALNPPVEYLNLIPIPYPGAFTRSSELWRYLNESHAVSGPPPLSLSPAAEAFFRSVFNPERSEAETPLEVWLNHSAYEQYRSWEAAGSHYAREFLTCLQQMREPRRLKAHTHGTFGKFHFYKRPHTRERPFFYTEPNPVHLYPQRLVERVIVCGLAVEQGNGQYDPTAQDLLADVDRRGYRRLSQLEEREKVLLVPLGQTPMVATQTYTLLHEADTEGLPSVSGVAVLYPEQSALIRKGVRLLRKQFVLQGVQFIRYPIRGLRDVDSEEACETYLGALLSAINDLRSRFPDGETVLSLSGGRKGMSALSLFAAQQTGTARVYHTLINDAELAERIEHETSLDELERLPTEAARADRLFLGNYDRAQFTLFRIPVIPVKC